MTTEKHLTIAGGFFISLEGPEGAGKSTQAQWLADDLRARGYQVLETREPGGTVLGEELRRLLKHLCGDDAPCPEAELMMMTASRAQLVRQVIMPFLAAGGVVVCDRFADSTTVYQGCARGLDSQTIDHLHAMATAGRWPDLTFLLDIAASERVTRTKARNGGTPLDRFEQESEAFHARVRDGFLRLANQHPERIRVIAGAASAQQVREQISEEVTRVLG